MGRAHHLKETLPKNLVDNADCPDLEYVVLDYNSTDGLEAWMRHFLASSPHADRVSYYRERTAKFFDPRHAKNAAHLLAAGSVVVNIDADNFTGPGYASELKKIFSAPDRIIVTSKTGIRSMCGKIALRKEDFVSLRGYDELFRGFGWEDPDLVNRAVATGFKEVKIKWSGEAVIDHCNEERVKNLEDKTPTGSSPAFNRRRAQARVPGSLLNPRGFGMLTVYCGLSTSVCHVGIA
jgi:glycosyltransferase involved in cell wall biosynthesis